MDKDYKDYTLEKICRIKDTLATWTEEEIGHGKECAHTKELGEVVDMIKDLCKAEKSCYEAEYYKSVVEAMEEVDENFDNMDDGAEDRYGYRRGSRSHRSMSGRRGYRPETIWMDEFEGHGMPGYHKNPMTMHESMEDMDHRYGKAYNDYKRSKKHYTETTSQSDKDEMKHHAMEHISDTMSSIREIWSTADPDLKKKIKGDMSALINEMTI